MRFSTLKSKLFNCFHGGFKFLVRKFIEVKINDTLDCMLKIRVVKLVGF